MKSRKNIIQLIIIGLFSIFYLSMGWASGMGKTFVLESMKKHPNAVGSAFIDKDHINLQTRGLKSDSIYTVWFVNMKPKKKETGAGAAPYMFRTDQWGNGNYSAPLKESPFGKWAMIMVVLHPDGNPKNMKTMVGALKAGI
jgi:hypothetical protein